MRIGASMLGVVVRLEIAVTGIVLSIVLLITSVSGYSSVIRNSESYYRDIPREPINWRECLTD